MRGGPVGAGPLLLLLVVTQGLVGVPLTARVGAVAWSLQVLWSIASKL